jgi:hypothetical protein
VLSDRAAHKYEQCNVAVCSVVVYILCCNWWLCSCLVTERHTNINSVMFQCVLLLCANCVVTGGCVRA